MQAKPRANSFQIRGFVLDPAYRWMLLLILFNSNLKWDDYDRGRPPHTEHFQLFIASGMLNPLEQAQREKLQADIEGLILILQFSFQSFRSVIYEAALDSSDLIQTNSCFSSFKGLTKAREREKAFE